MWLKAIQPLEEIHDYLQSILPGGLHHSAEFRPPFPHTWVIHKLKIPLLERDGIVEKKVWSIPENGGEGLHGEVPVETTRYIGEHKRNVVDQGLGEDGEQSGECIVGADSDTRDSTIGEDDNGSDGINMLLDLFRNNPLAELVLLKTTSVGESRGVEDADLGKRLAYSLRSKPSVLTTVPLVLVNSYKRAELV